MAMACAAAETVRGKHCVHKVFYWHWVLMQPASWRPLWVLVFWEMRNSECPMLLMPPEIVCRQLWCGRLAQCSPSVNMLLYVLHRLLQFSIYNDSIELRLVYFHVWFAHFQSRRPSFVLFTSIQMWHKKTHWKKSYLLVHMLITRGSIQTYSNNISLSVWNMNSLL